MVSGKLPGDARVRFALMSVKRWSQENAFYWKEGFASAITRDSTPESSMDFGVRS